MVPGDQKLPARMGDAMVDLKGRKAVVTGASRGIGQATAIALAQAGADVASLHLHDPDSAERTAAGIESAGRRALMVEGDVGDADQMRRFGEQVTEQFGRIDIWVNNASRLLVRPFLEMAESEWHDLMASNLFGYYYGCRAALTEMVPRGAGRIVNVSSITATQPIADMSAYITAKGGVVALTKSLAVEFAPKGIAINAVAPGAIETPLTAHAFTDEVRRLYSQRIAVGRVGRPADIVGAILFLASDAAAYVCGHELVVDGGLHLNGNVGFNADPPATKS